MSDMLQESDQVESRCGFAAFLAVSLWLTGAISSLERLRLSKGDSLSDVEKNNGGIASIQIWETPVSQRLTAREAAKPTLFPLDHLIRAS